MLLLKMPGYNTDIGSCRGMKAHDPAFLLLKESECLCPYRKSL